MSFGDSVKKLIGIEEIDADEITEEEVEAAKKEIEKEDNKAKRAPAKPAAAERPALASQPGGGERHFTMSNTGGFKLLLIEPKSFEESEKLVDSLKTRRPVILNLEKLETEVARKIFDFMNGATYALNGKVQKVANNIFIFAPDNVDIAGGQQPEKSNFEFGRDEQKTDNSSGNNWRY